MEKLEKHLNRLVTILLVISILICGSLVISRIKGEDANLFGFRIYHILTGSMEPTIRTGSNVLVRSVDPDTLEVGDIITFISRNKQIYGHPNTHRIISIERAEDGSKYFITQGDANPSADGQYVYPDEIKGKVIKTKHSQGFANFYSFMQTPYGFFSVIVLPLMFIISCALTRFKNEVDAIIEENNAAKAATGDDSDAGLGDSENKESENSIK